MCQNYKSITVLVLCYKQQEVIKRALDSVLSQKEYGLKKIVVCDDCSPDKTWDVLEDYKNRYPEYLDIYRNEKNMGIYQNEEKLMSLRGESDLYVNLSGDDAFSNGYFKAIQEYIQMNEVDFTVPICIYADFMTEMPDGKQMLHKQSIAANKDLNKFSLYIRYKLSGRSTMFNDLIVQKQQPTIFEKGLNLAESLYDCQKHYHVEKSYYVPVLGNIYFGGIGISAKLIDTDYYTTQAKAKWQYFLDHLIDQKSDVCLAQAEIVKCEFMLKPSWKTFTQSIALFKKSGYPNKVKYRDIKSFTYLMKRSVLHKYEKYLLLRLPIKVLYHL